MNEKGRMKGNVIEGPISLGSVVFKSLTPYSFRARLEAGNLASESESCEMISLYQESKSHAAVWLAY